MNRWSICLCCVTSLYRWRTVRWTYYSIWWWQILIYWWSLLLWWAASIARWTSQHSTRGWTRNNLSWRPWCLVNGWLVSSINMWVVERWNWIFMQMWGCCSISKAHHIWIRLSLYDYYWLRYILLRRKWSLVVGST